MLWGSSVGQDMEQDTRAREEGREGREEGHKVWRLVLTGGPCGGKTTAQVT